MISQTYVYIDRARTSTNTTTNMRTNRFAFAFPMGTTKSTPRLHDTSKTRIRRENGVNRTQVGHKGKTNTIRMRHGCIAYTQHEYGTNMTRIRHECNTNATRMQHECNHTAYIKPHHTIPHQTAQAHHTTWWPPHLSCPDTSLQTWT